MTVIKKIGLMVAVSVALCTASCTKNFEEINTDPDNLEFISPGTLLNPVIYGLAGFGTTRHDEFTMDIMQSRLPWPSSAGGVHRYVLTEAAGNSTWNNYYKWITNVNEIKAAAEKLEDKTYIAIAMTLRAFAGAQLTDCFGNIPMKDANKAEAGLLQPVFDEQKDIYTQLIADLDSANNLFDTKATMIYGTDLLFANDVSKWKRFCNSLHLRLLLRVSNKSEMNAPARLAAIINNPTKYPLIATNDQAAILKITGVTPNVSPWGRAIDFTTFRAVGDFFANTLNTYNDPRRARWMTQAKTADNITNIGYKGIPSGYAGGESQFNFIPSNMNIALATAPMVSVMMTYAEVEFIKAELAQKAILPVADAKSYYESAVKASIEQWGATVPVDYFTANNGAAAYDGTFEKIMKQKYLALFFNDYQQWFEYRRTGLPVLPKGDGMLNDKIMPVRFKYPSTVQTTNYNNYKLAVQAMGADDINAKVWWEK